MTCDCDCDCTVTVWRGAKRHTPHMDAGSQQITFSTAPGTKCDHSSFSHHHVITHRHPPTQTCCAAAQGTLSTPCAPPLAPTVLTASTRKCSMLHSHRFIAVLSFSELFASFCFRSVLSKQHVTQERRRGRTPYQRPRRRIPYGACLLLLLWLFLLLFVTQFQDSAGGGEAAGISCQISLLP